MSKNPAMEPHCSTKNPIIHEGKTATQSKKQAACDLLGRLCRALPGYGADSCASWVLNIRQLGGLLVLSCLFAGCLRPFSEEVWQPLGSRQMANPVMQDEND